MKRYIVVLSFVFLGFAGVASAQRSREMRTKVIASPPQAKDHHAARCRVLTVQIVFDADRNSERARIVLGNCSGSKKGQSTMLMFNRTYPELGPDKSIGAARFVPEGVFARWTLLALSALKSGKTLSVWCLNSKPSEDYANAQDCASPTRIGIE